MNKFIKKNVYMIALPAFILYGCQEPNVPNNPNSEKQRGYIEQSFFGSSFKTYVWWDKNIAYTISRKHNYIPTEQEKMEDSLMAVEKLREIEVLMDKK